MACLDVIWHGLRDSFLMAWAVWWALVLGFAISAIVQAWVPRERIEGLMSGSGPRPVGWATGLGAASSSCSYAAIAIGKSLFQKGASAASALAFQFASTNLVWELGLVLWVLIGWQFTLAEYVGGIVMIVLMTVMLRLFVSRQLEEHAREHAQEADSGHQHHAAGEELSWRERLTSARAWSDVAHNFRGDWQMLWKEITIGFLLAGFIAQFGNGFFEQPVPPHAPAPLPTIENVIIGPIIAVLSFVCSVGNVPLAAVLWSGGISFAGVLAFLFADLIVLPILLIYRKYYGTTLHGADHRADVRHDGDRRADRQRHLQRTRPAPDRTATDPRRHLHRDPRRLQARAEPARRRDLRRPVLAHRPPRCDRPGVRDEGRPRQGCHQGVRRARPTTSAQTTACTRSKPTRTST